MQDHYLHPLRTRKLTDSRPGNTRKYKGQVDQSHSGAVSPSHSQTEQLMQNITSHQQRKELARFQANSLGQGMISPRRLFNLEPTISWDWSSQAVEWWQWMWLPAPCLPAAGALHVHRAGSLRRRDASSRTRLTTSMHISCIHLTPLARSHCKMRRIWASHQ